MLAVRYQKKETVYGFHCLVTYSHGAEVTVRMRTSEDLGAFCAKPSDADFLLINDEQLIRKGNGPGKTLSNKRRRHC